MKNKTDEEAKSEELDQIAEYLAEVSENKFDVYLVICW
jgi:hypothetical protein